MESSVDFEVGKTTQRGGEWLWSPSFDLRCLSSMIRVKRGRAWCHILLLSLYGSCENSVKVVTISSARLYEYVCCVSLDKAVPAEILFMKPCRKWSQEAYVNALNVLIFWVNHNMWIMYSIYEHVEQRLVFRASFSESIHENDGWRWTQFIDYKEGRPFPEEVPVIPWVYAAI